VTHPIAIASQQLACRCKLRATGAMSRRSKRLSSAKAEAVAIPDLRERPERSVGRALRGHQAERGQVRPAPPDPPERWVRPVR
jgi:hypothetical protein